MTNYLIRRMIQMLLVVVVSSLAIYLLMWYVPGGPLSDLNKTGADRRTRHSPEEIARIKDYLGFQRGPWWGYVAWLTGEDWMGVVPQALWWPDDKGVQQPLQRVVCIDDQTQCTRGVIRGDFGDSWSVARGAPVAKVIGDRLRNTLVLMTLATVLSLVVAVPVGIYSAVRQYSMVDYITTTFTFFGTAMPVFWFALMMILAFGGNQSPLAKAGLPYMPTGNVIFVRPPQAGSLAALLGIEAGTWADIAVHAVMPTIVLSLLYMAGWSRYTRSSMLEVLRQDYVRTARAKGLVERVVIVKHAMRNALIPLVTILVLEIPAIFGGAIITETVFNWQGMGFLYFSSLGSSDYPVALAFLFITAILVVIATLLGDVLYTIVDPRIRFS
jgi:peptide/nickel transport system permease protein